MTVFVAGAGCFWAHQSEIQGFFAPLRVTSNCRYSSRSTVTVANQVFDVAYLVDDEVEFARECLDFGFGAAVDIEVEFAAEAVLSVLAILAHHDDRRLEGGEHGEKEVEKDEGVGIPGV